MLHRNMKDLDIMRLSLDKLTNGKPKHVIIAGDFNCPDLDWVNMEIKTLELWADKWGMKFNAKKCGSHIKHPYSRVDLTIPK
jgi:hypothetical protein